MFSYLLLQCPWNRQIEARYLQMTYVTSCTIFETIYLSIVLLLAKGWTVSRLAISRNDMSSITVLMALTYLGYSTYYVSLNVTQLQTPVSLMLNLLYMASFIFSVRSLIQIKRFLAIQ